MWYYFWGQGLGNWVKFVCRSGFKFTVDWSSDDSIAGYYLFLSLFDADVAEKIKNFQASPITIGNRQADVEAKRANSRG